MRCNASAGNCQFCMPMYAPGYKWRVAGKPLCPLHGHFHFSLQHSSQTISHSTHGVLSAAQEKEESKKKNKHLQDWRTLLDKLCTSLSPFPRLMLARSRSIFIEGSYFTFDSCEFTNHQIRPQFGEETITRWPTAKKEWNPMTSNLWLCGLTSSIVGQACGCVHLSSPVNVANTPQWHRLFHDDTAPQQVRQNLSKREREWQHWPTGYRLLLCRMNELRIPHQRSWKPLSNHTLSLSTKQLCHWLAKTWRTYTKEVTLKKPLCAVMLAAGFTSTIVSMGHCHPLVGFEIFAELKSIQCHTHQSSLGVRQWKTLSRSISVTGNDSQSAEKDWNFHTEWGLAHAHLNAFWKASAIAENLGWSFTTFSSSYFDKSFWWGQYVMTSIPQREKYLLKYLK